MHVNRKWAWNLTMVQEAGQAHGVYEPYIAEAA